MRGTRGWIVPDEPCLPLLGYVTGAGRNVGGSFGSGSGGKREQSRLPAAMGRMTMSKNKMNDLVFKVQT